MEIAVKRHKNTSCTTEISKKIREVKHEQNCGDAPLLKKIVKQAIEEMIKAERRIYLETNLDTKANGYYTRNLGTPIGMIEQVKVARSRERGFNSQLLPYRKRYMVDVGELVEALFASGLSTRRISRLLEVLYGMKLSPQTASQLAGVGTDEVRGWKQRRLEELYPVVILDATFFPLGRAIRWKRNSYILPWA